MELTLTEIRWIEFCISTSKKLEIYTAKDIKVSYADSYLTCQQTSLPQCMILL